MQKLFHPYACLICLVIILTGQYDLNAQPLGKIFSQHFTTKDYPAGAQNWEIAQAKDGVFYIGNQAGLLRYDGSNWELFKISLASTIRTVDITDDGKILVGGINELGYFALDKAGKLKYNSLVGLIDTLYQDFGDVWNVEFIDDSWFFQTDNYLFHYKDHKITSIKKTGDYFYLSYKLKNQLYLLDLGKGLYTFGSGSLKLMPGGDFFASKKILSILPYQDKLLIGTRSDGLFIYDPDDPKTKIVSVSNISEKAKTLNKFFILNEIYAGTTVDDDKFVVGTINGGAIVFDNNFVVSDVINKESCGQISTIYHMHYANDGNLWLATDNGIQKIELATPFRFWDSEAGIVGNITDFAEFDQSCFIASTMGVFYLDKLNPDRFFGISKFVPTGIKDQVWSFIVLREKSLGKRKKTNNSPNKVLGKHVIRDSSLIFATNSGIYTMSGKKPVKIFNYEKIYSLYPSLLDSSLIYLGLRDGISRISYQNGTWYHDGKLPHIGQQLYGLAQDTYGNLWFSWGTKGLSKIPAQYTNVAEYANLEMIPNKVVNFDENAGLPIMEGVVIYNVNKDVKFYADSGDYVFNYSLNRFEKDPSVGPDYIDSTWAGDVFVDPKNKFWINAIEKNKKSGKYYADSITFKRLDNYQFSIIFRDNSERLWIGTPQGVFCYDEKYKKQYHREYPAIIKSVYLNDSVLYHGINYNPAGTNQSNNDFYPIDFSNRITLNPQIPYRLNSISFTYSSTSYEADFKNEYSYYLEGYDKGWSGWTSEIKKAYTNLPEGKYVFRVKARNFYQIESSEASYEFRILTPWFRSWWALLIYMLLISLVIIVIVKVYTYRLQIEKDRLENLVMARTQEILMQNEEIKVQAENLKEASEKIQAKNRELENQKSELELRKDELEISNATKNKFFRIIAHDLRNPISTFVSSTNYILDDYEKHGSEKTRIFLAELNKLSKTTFNLLENLLEWSTNQMGAIKFEPRKINISNLFKENVDLITHLLEVKMIKIYSSLPNSLEVIADEHMLNTVVRNLLSNAVKFTGENGKIEIAYRIANRACEISISDTGVGIAGEDIEKLFRIDIHHSTQGTRDEKGSGLGLILCKDFIEKNGGEIQVTSTPGKGSTFSFRLKME